ncbi:hypothetical protein [Mesobacterium pallidum]|uniref:hypothetical protein n=1 Tax=Mesobacterium pallidum TaxID=2872037 RepID=UPI001EE285DB|nr:hypothetical protein [Mesobacterium pallidum]
MTRTIALLGLALLAAGCSNDRYTRSGFVDASSGGNIPRGFDQVAAEGSDFDNGDGYAYKVGEIEGKGFVAHAGLTEGTAVAAPPSTGSAVMTGSYEAGYISGITRSGDYLQGWTGSARSGLTLTADFDDGTLSGTSTDRRLRVRGTFSGRDLSGEVTFDNDDGDLEGLVGPGKAIGVFHGNDDTDVFAGGFIVTQ